MTLRYQYFRDSEYSHTTKKYLSSTYQIQIYIQLRKFLYKKDLLANKSERKWKLWRVANSQMVQIQEKKSARLQEKITLFYTSFYIKFRKDLKEVI